MIKLIFSKVVFGSLLLLVSFSNSVVGQDTPEATPPTIDFVTEIVPILSAHCYSCHNEVDEEAGLNLEDVESLSEFVIQGKPLESPLYQSLLGTDGLSEMPPEENDDGPLPRMTTAEIAQVYLWIEQGAITIGATDAEDKTEETRSVAHRLFLFSGYFHPAIVHFPIALFTISAFFIVFCFRNTSLSDDAAYYLLFLGTLSAIVACIVGWANAAPKTDNLTDLGSGMNRHRWLGIAVGVIAIVATVLGWRSRNDVSKTGGGIWKLGVLICAALVGLVGHQGGELVYGESFYEKKAEKLIPELWPFATEADDADQNEKAPQENKTVEDQDEKGAAKSVPKDPDPSPESDAKKENENGPTTDETENSSPPVDPTIKSQ